MITFLKAIKKAMFFMTSLLHSCYASKNEKLKEEIFSKLLMQQ